MPAFFFRAVQFRRSLENHVQAGYEVDCINDSGSFAYSFVSFVVRLFPAGYGRATIQKAGTDETDGRKFVTNGTTENSKLVQ